MSMPAAGLQITPAEQDSMDPELTRFIRMLPRGLITDARMLIRFLCFLARNNSRWFLSGPKEFMLFVIFLTQV